jgi:hypothetical protein
VFVNLLAKYHPYIRVTSNFRNMKNILSIALFSIPMMVGAQSITPDVIASAGNHFENGGVQLSWTLGEIAVSTYENGGNILTEGFHQPELLITKIEEVSELDMTVNIFPNPTADFINIEFTGNETDMLVELFDMNGKEVSRIDVRANQPEVGVNVSEFAIGGYLLRLTEENGKYVSAHQIQKSR